jgi:hypothetical protein
MIISRMYLHDNRMRMVKKVANHMSREGLVSKSFGFLMASALRSKLNKATFM